MSVVIDLHLKAKDKENYDKLYQTLQAILPDTAAFEGAHLISCSANADDMSFIVHEVWESAEHQQAYIGWRQERGEIEALVSMLGEDPQFVQREHLVFG
ncbi:MAG: antibiotic biosynthesis monooxygenase [Pseudomonadota bacterium]